MPPRDRTVTYREPAEARFYRYHGESRDLLDTARSLGDRGEWDEAANTLAALAQTVAAMTGVAREMHLLTMLAEER